MRVCYKRVGYAGAQPPPGLDRLKSASSKAPGLGLSGLSHSFIQTSRNADFDLSINHYASLS